MEEALYVVRTMRMLANDGRVADYDKADCATGAESWPWYRKKKQRTRNDEMTNRTSAYLPPRQSGERRREIDRQADRRTDPT
jgi:hypothetical protein